MGRDHSIECETCGQGRGGLNDLQCDCDDPHAALLIATMLCEAECSERLDTLATNLATAAALCASWKLGWTEGKWSGEGWRPGCGREAT